MYSPRLCVGAQAADAFVRRDADDLPGHFLAELAAAGKDPLDQHVRADRVDRL